MFIRLRFYDPKLKKAWIVQSPNFPSFSARLSGKQFQGLRVSARVSYSNKRKDLFSELPSRLIKTKQDQKQFLSDLYETSCSDEVKFHLNYWGLKEAI